MQVEHILLDEDNWSKTVLKSTFASGACQVSVI